MPARYDLTDDVLYARDCRSGAVPTRRQKEKKVRYRNVNVNLLGTERATGKGPDAVWNDRNKYKMTRTTHTELGSADSNNCHCVNCRRDTGRLTAKKHAALMLDVRGLDQHAVCKKHQGGKSKASLENSILSDDGTVSGVLYSYEASTSPGSRTSDILEHLVTQAETKYENNVLDKLVKTEYEFVDTSEEDSDEEFELI